MHNAPCQQRFDPRRLKQFLKAALARTPYRIAHRTALNRFQAVDQALASLARRDFRPRAVVDGGANTGAFARAAFSFFPGAVVHAVEPQPGCWPALESLRDEFPGRVVLHPVALCGPEDQGASLRLTTDASATSTGAHVTSGGDTSGGDCLSVPGTTLDAALGPHASAINPALLKLDLQGYELNALRGATATLAKTDVVLTEVSFYAQGYEPPISRLVAFLAERGFELYDVASIYARRRDDRPRQGDFVFVRVDADLARDKAWS